MATLDEIFAAMPEEAAAPVHDYFEIDPEARQINVPDTESIFGVTADGQTETKYFICPRIVGNGLDLAACFLRINYRNANGEIDAYLVQDAAVNGEYITFSWELSKHVLQYKGSVQFIVCAIMPGSNGKYPEWNTTLATGAVLEGLEPDGAAAQAATADVIAQLLALVTSQTAAVEAAGAAQVKAVKAEGSAQVAAVEAAAAQAEADALAEVEAKGKNTLASIPEDYTEMGNQVDRLTRNTAPAIVCTAEGKSILLQDSSDCYLQGLRVFGKTTQQKTTGAQLLPIVTDSTKTDRGLTQSVIGGVCTVRGKANNTAAFNLTLYGSYYNTEPVFTLPPGTYTAQDCMVVSSDGTTQKKYENTTFTLQEALGVTWVATRSYQPGEVVAETTHPMINAGDTALPWEPYSGGVASPSPAWPQALQSVQVPGVSAYGKNLIPNINSKTAGGITFTANSDGSFTVNGTADAYRNGDSDPLDARPYRGKTVTLSGKRIFGSGLALQLFSKCETGNVFNTITGKDPITFKIPEDAITITLQCYVTNNATVENVVIYPQLELGDKETEFEPYRAQALAVTTPGSLPGIPVTSGGNYTDETGQQWICDEIDLGRGVYVQRVKTLDLTGDEAIERDDGTTWAEGCYTVYTAKNNPAHKHGEMLCSFLPNYNNAVIAEKADVNGIGTHGAPMLLVRFDASINTLEAATAAWKTAIAAGGQVNVVLETPVETPLDEATLAAFRALHSNKPTTVLLNDAGAHMAVVYVADTKLYVDRKLAELTAANNT